uniref:3-hydroxy-5-isopropenylpimelyl CoA dehydrogenase n=1 Tax=Pseudomonas sp. 19-rlim TaxID=1084570 RepID=G3LGT6_9PSED|nr:3-hydroxy-5-isopropenylpimelyl CoA dehydrogenase [Pseudomonas sp. 19-rlim]
MITDPNIRTDLDADGILLVTIDMPGRAMNVFSAAMMDSLEKVLDLVEQEPSVRGLVITSGKQAFLAGADLEMIRMFTDRAEVDSPVQLHDLCGRLGRLFLRLEQIDKPSVAAVNGLALGGGLELALACHQRVALDSDAVLLGLPEIKLGLLPGAGGTQRLPRLIEINKALAMLLGGDPVGSREALELGLVDRLSTASELIATAKALVLAPRRKQANWYAADFVVDSSVFDAGGADPFANLCQVLDISAYQRSRYPAYEAIMNCVYRGLPLDMPAAVSLEMDIFVELIRDPVAGNMVKTLFLERQKAAKLRPDESFRTARIALAGSDLADLGRQLEKRRAQLADVSALGEDDVLVLARGGVGGKGLKVHWLTDSSADLESGAIGLWVSAKGTHGRAAEVFQAGVCADCGERDAALLVANLLGASCLLSHGSRPLLPLLNELGQQCAARQCSEEDRFVIMAMAALQDWNAGLVDQPDMVDMACVIAGIYPSFSGGPFKFLRNLGLEQARALFDACRTRHADLLSGEQDMSGYFSRHGRSR